MHADPSMNARNSLTLTPFTRPEGGCQVAYIAKWMRLIDGEDDLDPVEIARRGLQHLLDPTSTAWMITDLESGEITDGRPRGAIGQTRCDAVRFHSVSSRVKPSP